MRKHQLAYACLLIVTLATAAIVALYFNDTPSSPGRRLVMPGSARSYRLLVAETPEAQAKGLGDRASLGKNIGMLFVQGRQAEQCFWMKDMRFAVDMIWVDSDKRITALQSAVRPETYPRTYCATAAYVIELNAGEAAKNNLEVGQRLTF